MRIGRILVTLVVALMYFVLPFSVQAQGFGSDPDNYECARYRGKDGVIQETQDGITCVYVLDDGSLFVKDAILKPPQLQILQVWFVRILYVIWGVSGVVFTFILISIGMQYLLSFGNVDAVGQVIKRFQKFVVGLALVFLSYPLLATFFQLLPLNEDTCYADVQMPGFQFFFPNACIVETGTTTP